jgi:MFS family permease
VSYRRRVLAFLSLLSVITYLDRVCISIAGPRMQEALRLDPQQWGWVTGAFTLSYALFEIPGGMLGDRVGPRRVLTRIVLWWSAFTSLTGAVSNFLLLVAVRFAFGMGEAGAYPNIGVAISRWFPLRERATAYGVVLMSAQLGGALAPVLVVPIQQAFGWRASFWVFGLLGMAWAAAWFRWFRDSPREMPGAAPEELALAAALPARHRPLPWGRAVRNGSLWALIGMACCAGYTLAFFQSWLGTYLVRARGFSETGLLLAALPFVVGALANAGGGLLGDRCARRFGLRTGRRVMFLTGYGGAALFLAGSFVVEDKYAALGMLSLTYGGLTLAQPALMGVCLDMGGRYSGAVTGAMNSAAHSGGFLSSVLFGYLVNRFGNFTAPFVPMLTLMAASALLGLSVDAERPVVPEASATPAPD